jgi:hypothetical protein
MVTYSLSLDDSVDDDSVIVLNEHEDSIQPSESSFDADGDTDMQDVHENLKTPLISDVGYVLTMRPCSSVDFFMSPDSYVEDDEESDADSATSLLGLALFVDEDDLDVDSLCMSSAGSYVGDQSDADSVTSLFGLAFLDEDELDEDSLSMSPGSPLVDEELEVEVLVTPSVLFLDGSDNVDDNNSETGSSPDVDLYAFIMADMEQNRDRWISLACQTVHGLSLMFLLVFEQITLGVFVFGCLFTWLSSLVMPGKVGRQAIPNPVVYLSCPVSLPRRGVKLATIEEEGDGEVEQEEDKERSLRWAPLVPLRGVKLAPIKEEEDEDDRDVNEEESDSLDCPPLVPIRGLQLYATGEEGNEEQPQEQPEQEENDDFGPSIDDDDEEEDPFEEDTATDTSARSEPTVPLFELRRSTRIAAKAGKKLILPVGTEGSLFVNGKRRSARLSLF